MENMVAHNAIIANKQVVDIGHLDIYSILSLLVLKHSQNMGCRQCDIITGFPIAVSCYLLVKLQTTLERFSTRLDDLIVELRKGYYTATVQP